MIAGAAEPHGSFDGFVPERELPFEYPAHHNHEGLKNISSQRCSNRTTDQRRFFIEECFYISGISLGNNDLEA